MSEVHDRVEALFAAAMALETEAERVDYLDRECPDPGLRREVESLLATFETPDPVFLTEVVRATPRVEEGVGTQIGRYRLMEQIGVGGYGVVYVAEQTKPLRRHVALKVIKQGMDTRGVIARFEAERQALALMDHPNIARVLDAGTTEAGRPFFVMELVRGVRITEYCDEARLTTPQRLELFIKVCQAIQHAHQKGIIHRDIKPSNILVTLHDGVPVPKVIDFGIAKATERSLSGATVYTQLHEFLGTPAYMSPEQAEMSGLDVDTRSDIYSLGVLLYEILAGRPPFDGQQLLSMGLDAMRKTIRETDPPRPSTRLANLRGEEQTTTATRRRVETSKLASLLRGDLDWIVMKCLEKNRARRYETANGLAADLRRHLNHEPITARPPGTAYRLQKAFRRNKLVFTAAAVVTFTLIVAVAVSTGLAIRATRAEEEQNRLRQQAVKALERETSQRKAAEAEHERAEAQALKAVQSEHRAHRLLYAADISLAQQSFERNNFGLARRLLDRHRPQPGEEDLRGWEWRYLWQQTRNTALVTLTNRPSMGFSVSFSPDGRHLAVGWSKGSGDPQVDLWDVPGRRRVRTWEDPGNRNYQGRVAFSPVRNLLAATTASKTLSLYDVDSDRESMLWQIPEEGWWSIRDLSFSQDGSRLAIYAGSSPNRGAAVWVIEIPSGRVEKRYPTVCPISWWLGAARLSPDGQRLYLSRSDLSAGTYTIQCLDLATDRPVWETEPKTDEALSALAVSPDGQVLASGSGYRDHHLYVWEASTGRLLRQLEGHNARVCALAISDDGRQLVSASADQDLRSWNTDTWTESRVFHGHNAPVFAVAISQTARLVASASMDGDLMLWDTEAKYPTGGQVQLPTGTDGDRVFPLPQSRLLLLPPDQASQVVDLRSRSTPTPLPGLGPSAQVLGCSGTNLLITWNGTNRIVIRAWQGPGLITLGEIPVEPGPKPGGFAYHAPREWLAWTEASSPNSVHLATLSAPARRIELQSDAGAVSSLLFSDDGTHLAARTQDGLRLALRVWNVETGEIVVSVNEWVTSWAFAAGGRTLFVCPQAGNDTLFFDLSHSRAAPRRLTGRYPCWTLAVSPDGRWVAGNTLRTEVHLWDAASGEQIGSLHGNRAPVHSSAFSPDGRRLLTTGGGDRTAIVIWDLGTRQELLALAGTEGRGYWAADGETILVGGPPLPDGTIPGGKGLQAWLAPSWEEVAAAEAPDKAETRGP